MGNAETQFLDALYLGATDKGELKRALTLAQKMFNCQGGALISFDAQAPATDIAVTSGLFDEYEHRYLNQFAAIDPAPAAFSRLPAGTVSSTDRLLTPETCNTHPFVNEFFRPIGLVETLGCNLFSAQACFSLIGVQRGKDRPQFDDADIAKMERLAPHITRALQLRRSFFRLEIENLGLHATIDRLPAGLVLLDSDGEGLCINAAMQGIARRADGLALDRRGRLRPVSPEARRRLEALLHDVAYGGAGGMLRVPRANGERDYVVLVAPSPSIAQTRWDRRGSVGAIVLVHDPTARPMRAPEILERGLNLPKGTAKLVAALAADDDLKSFAEREGVTIHTARFHLHTALARTGARTQAELMRLAVRLLRDFALADRER